MMSFNAQLYHSNLIKSGSLQILHFGNYLLSLYFKDGHLEPATKLFDEIPDRDVKTWTILISSFSRYGHHRDALDYFSGMQIEGIVAPNSFTLSSVIKCCACISNGLQMGKAIHGWILRNDTDADIPLKNAILDLYAKFRRFASVKMIFEQMDDKDATSWNIVMATMLRDCEMEECLNFFRKLPNKNISSWNTILDGLVQLGLVKSALELTYELVKVGPSFNEVTFSIALILVSSLKCLKLGRQIHVQLLRSGISEDSFVCTSLIDMYCKCMEIHKASVLFKELRSRCSKCFHDGRTALSFSGSIMISGYVQRGMIKKAMLYFNSMIREQLDIDFLTLASIATASATATQLELGQQIHCRALKVGHGQDIVLCSSLINMYAKCGKLDDARSYFWQDQTRNIVLWSVMIQSCGIHGLGREAIELFELMQNEGIRPNEVSFVVLLTACSHAGLIKEGCDYFRMMIEVFRIEPEIEHFTCMIDLFGRAGQLKEIRDFVYETGICYLQEVWKAYLSSCWLHKNAEIANWVSKKLHELVPHRSDSYLLLSNTCSANQAWDEAARLRGLMHQSKPGKYPGQSWI